MLKVSTIYLEKPKGFIPKKDTFYAVFNIKALFTDPIFIEGFGQPIEKTSAPW